MEQVLRNKDGLTEKEFLDKYNPGDYKRPSVTADIMVIGMDKYFSNLKLLLIKRGDHPFMNQWALPGGFINDNETAYQAAARELEEETGLKNVYLDQIYTFTKPGRDPRTWVMSIAYMALVQNLDNVKGMDDAADAAWFDLIFNDDSLILYNLEKNVEIRYNLKSKTFKNGILSYQNYVPTHETGFEELAFDHVEIILESLLKLRNEFLYSNKAFCLVSDEFTLPELQKVYEVVLGQKLYKKSFRDIVKNKVLETGYERKSQIKGGRTSKIYKYLEEK